MGTRKSTLAKVVTKKSTTSKTVHKGFLVLNKNAQVWCGLQGGKPVFSDNWDDAKPLYNDQQFFNLRMAADYQDRDFEQVWL